MVRWPSAPVAELLTNATEKSIEFYFSLDGAVCSNESQRSGISGEFAARARETSHEASCTTTSM
jgi:hypothetical protein